MQSRRIVWMNVLALVLFSGLAYAAPAPAKITFATWAFSGPNMDAVKQTVDWFSEANPDIEVSIQQVTCCNEATIEKYVVQIAAGKGPDIMQLPYACFADMASGGMLLPLDDLIAKDEREVDPQDIFPPAWEAVTYNGRRYGMPYDLSAQWMAFTPQNFSEAGLENPIRAYEKGIWNWNSLRDVARKITQRDAEGKPSRIGMIIQYNELLGQPWLYQTGSTPFAANLLEARISDAAIVTALRFLHDLQHQDRTLLSAWSEPVADPKQGLFGVWPQWLSIPYYFQGSSFPTDIVPAPEGPVGQVTTGQIHGIAIWEGTNHPLEAWQFTKFITGKKGYQPHIDRGLAPIRRSLSRYYIQTVGSALGTQGVELFLQDIHRLRLFQVTRDWGSISTAIHQGLSPVWAGTAALETTLAKLQDQVNALLRQ